MRIVIAEHPLGMGAWVAAQAAAALREAVDERGHARLIVATGSSQFEVLRALVAAKNVPWERVTGFHLDEYLGIAADHPASFCRYLQERFVSKVPLAAFHFLQGTGMPQQWLAPIVSALEAAPIDVALVGIGENGHLAFNDPPADFQTEQPYLIVRLDQACRAQQVGEGWFPTLDSVPTEAISMSVRQILKSRRIFCSVPDQRKSVAVQKSVEGPVDPLVPASILQTHGDIDLVLDRAAASLLGPASLERAREV